MNGPIINLTGHVLHVANENGVIIATIPTAGRRARVELSFMATGEIILGAPVVTCHHENVINLPPEKRCPSAPRYIVSSLVQSACPNRQDLLAPDTGHTAIKNENKKVIAIRRFRNRTLKGVQHGN
jgi:hypothetical protein